MGAGRFTTSSASASETRFRPCPECPVLSPPILFRDSSVEFSFMGIFDEGVELPNGRILAGFVFPPHCASFKAAFSFLSLAISRSFSAMISFCLSMRQVSSVYLLHRLRYGHFEGSTLSLLPQTPDKSNALVQEQSFHLAPVFNCLSNNLDMTRLHMHTFAYAILAIGEYPCRVTFARFAGFTVLTCAALVDERECATRNRE